MSDTVKHQRHDLNIAHLIARSGIILPFDEALLTQRNKNDWLPIHLSKHCDILCYLLPKTHINMQDIIVPGLINNAESIQTQYGVNLEKYLIEQGFSTEAAKSGASMPTDTQRVALAYAYMSMLKCEWFNSFKANPVEIAIANCNSFFFWGLKKLEQNNHALFLAFFEAFFKHESLNSTRYFIGQHYYASERAFQVQQQLKQFWGVSRDIQINQFEEKNVSSDDYLKNLEGA